MRKDQKLEAVVVSDEAPLLAGSSPSFSEQWPLAKKSPVKVEPEITVDVADDGGNPSSPEVLQPRAGCAVSKL